MEGQLLSALLKEAIPVLATLFGTILTILSGQLVSYINTKIKNEKLNEAAHLAQETVYNTVLGLEKTLVSEFMKANEDGKLTDEEKKQIKQSALASIHKQLNPNVKKALRLGYENLDEYLDMLMERMVQTETK